MKITRVSGVVYRQQLKSGGPKPKFAGEGRNAFETLLVKVETDDGIVGWGEAFPHRVWPAVKSLLETLIAPVCIGADPTDIPALMRRLIYHVHGVGRAGPVMYALSGLDIALWDILGKAKNQPIYKTARRRANARKSRPMPACSNITTPMSWRAPASRRSAAAIANSRCTRPAATKSPPPRSCCASIMAVR